jgi:hypothetical protein
MTPKSQDAAVTSKLNRTESRDFEERKSWELSGQEAKPRTTDTKTVSYPTLTGVAPNGTVLYELRNATLSMSRVSNPGNTTVGFIVFSCDAQFMWRSPAQDVIAELFDANRASLLTIPLGRFPSNVCGSPPKITLPLTPVPSPIDTQIANVFDRVVFMGTDLPPSSYWPCPSFVEG